MEQPQVGPKGAAPKGWRAAADRLWRLPRFWCPMALMFWLVWECPNPYKSFLREVHRKRGLFLFKEVKLGVSFIRA